MLLVVVIAVSGIVCYVFPDTLMLERRTHKLGKANLSNLIESRSGYESP